ncbi:MAG: hypothetical protein PHG23_01810 [Candidatus Pacebacteria bacterium]|nr:hypothetical protein [Candidatus Paceibacterota bacterium]
MDKQNFDSDQIKNAFSALQKMAMGQAAGKPAEPAQKSEDKEKPKKEKKEPKVILEAKGIFVLTDQAGKEIESGLAKLVLDEEKISVSSENGKATILMLNEISDFSGADFKVVFSLAGGGKAVVSELGYEYDGFVESLTKLRHEVNQKEMLMKEGGVKGSFEGNYSYKKNGEDKSGEAEVEISDTGLVIKPKQGDLIRISFSEIGDFSAQDYAILITAESAEISLSGFGERFDSLNKAISESLNELSLKTQSIINQILPELDPLAAKKASELLKDGQAVNKEQIDNVSPAIWEGLEKKLAEMAIKESYDYLMSLSKTKQVFLGIKRDLMGDLTGEYIWFLVPISSGEIENFIVMEAASTVDGGGKASYIFKIPENEKIGDLVKKINRCMFAINFRREPIYLKEEDLEKPDYLKYKTAIEKIPELKLIRQIFAGRVVHSSPEEWKKNVNEIINKNK